jgi:superfamily II DNA or RNA helicase
MIIGMIKVRIDNRLRVRKRDLPIGHEAAIKQRLTVTNGEKAAARKRNQWGWQDLPDAFMLYAEHGYYLVMPRGYAAELRAGLRAADCDVQWDDRTAAPSLPLFDLVNQGPTLRPDQEEACVALLQNRQGVLQAPTAAGKTVIVLEAWRRAGLRGLILVEKAGLAKQWRERAREHLGVETGMIGEGEWDERPLTIAMMQTLRSRDPSEEWWRTWGFTCFDEAHHCQAETYQKIAREVVSRYMVGVTATPLEGMWQQPYLTHTIGPIFHITTPESLRRAGLRQAPMIRRVHTGWIWTPANKREEALTDTKAIYRHVIKALETDMARAHLIAKQVVSQPPECAQLVLAKRLGYLDLIADAIVFQGYEGEVMMMRGQESGDKRTHIAELADDGRCVILSTVADEGTDIPRLDRLHLVWPQRKELTLTQQIGRVLRTHPDKRGVVIFDYVDEEGVLQSQARSRLMVYRRAGYAIEQEMTMQGSLTV